MTPIMSHFEIGIIGHTGRLGRRVVEAAEARSWAVTLRRNRQGSIVTGEPSVIFESASPQATAASVDTALALNAALVLATSGRSRDDDRVVREAAARIPVVIAGNLTEGHRIQKALARLVVTMAGTAERHVVDRHCTTKKDAPSATALALHDALGEATVEVLRHGAPVADHHIILTWPDEVLEIVHRVTSLEPAVQGALTVIRRTAALDKAGLYSLDDIFSLHDARVI